MPYSVEIVVPVLNEEQGLSSRISTLHKFLSVELKEYNWLITIADNGSTDSTLDIAKQLSAEYREIKFIYLSERGRGRALRKAWLDSTADVVAYTDVDLSTDLNVLPAMVNVILNGGYDIAIGSRLKNGSQVIGRSFKREFISRLYSLIVRSMFWSGIRDFQCGFKVIAKTAADDLIPLVEDTGWFFDTELLILAEKNKYRIKEEPVKWIDDPDTRVKIIKTAYIDLRGLLRLRFGGLRKASGKIGG